MQLEVHYLKKKNRKYCQAICLQVFYISEVLFCFVISTDLKFLGISCSFDNMFYIALGLCCVNRRKNNKYFEAWIIIVVFCHEKH